MISFLVVDDDPKIANLYELLIKRRYNEVLVIKAHDGKEALDKAETSDYSIILTDIDMPIMNGIDFHKTLKKKSPLLAEKTVFISGGPQESHLEYIRGENLPYLPKPFQWDEFYGIINTILEAKDNKSIRETEFGCYRKYERREVQVECLLEPLDIEITPGEVIKGELVDISEGGLGFKYGSKCFAEKTTVRVSIKALNILTRIAQVRWVSKDDRGLRYGLMWV